MFCFSISKKAGSKYQREGNVVARERSEVGWRSAWGRPPIFTTRIYAGSPVCSLNPRRTLAFCSAWPAAPLTRLSIAEIMMSVG